jgi:septal ring factor EnvC (AmiA/AmiB activator)
MKDRDMITITKDGIRTIYHGALGAMTFGAYHHYISDKMMKMNNRYFEKQIQEQQREIQEQQREIQEQQREIQELYKEVQALKQRRWWF